MATGVQAQTAGSTLPARRDSVWVELLRAIRRDPPLVTATIILLMGFFFALFSTLVARTEYGG